MYQPMSPEEPKDNFSGAAEWGMETALSDRESGDVWIDPEDD